MLSFFLTLVGSIIITNTVLKYINTKILIASLIHLTLLGSNSSFPSSSNSTPFSSPVAGSNPILPYIIILFRQKKNPEIFANRFYGR